MLYLALFGVAAIACVTGFAMVLGWTTTLVAVLVFAVLLWIEARRP